MKVIVLALVLIATATLATAQTSTPTPAGSTTAAPGNGTTTPSPSGPVYGVFGCKLGDATNGSAIIISFWDPTVPVLRYSLMHNFPNANNITFLGSNIRDATNATVQYVHTGSIAPNQLLTGVLAISGEQIGWLYDGKMQLRISSPSSEIRSTIGFAPYYGWKYLAFLSSQQTNNSQSNAVGLMIVGGEVPNLSVNIQHNATNAQQITINGPAAPCQSGSVLATMPSAGLSTSNVFNDATAATFNAMDNGNAYVQITSAGSTVELRGQIYPSTYYTNSGKQAFQVTTCQQSTPTPTPTSNAFANIPSMILVAVAVIVSLML